jgi:hypothetical protein
MEMINTQQFIESLEKCKNDPSYKKVERKDKFKEFDLKNDKDQMSLEERVALTRMAQVNDKRNFESANVMQKWRKENDQIKSFIYKMNIGKKMKIWKQPTFLDKTKQ